MGRGMLTQGRGGAMGAEHSPRARTSFAPLRLRVRNTRLGRGRGDRGLRRGRPWQRTRERRGVHAEARRRGGAEARRRGGPGGAPGAERLPCIVARSVGAFGRRLGLSAPLRLCVRFSKDWFHAKIREGREGSVRAALPALLLLRGPFDGACGVALDRLRVPSRKDDQPAARAGRRVARLCLPEAGAQDGPRLLASRARAARAGGA